MTYYRATRMNNLQLRDHTSQSSNEKQKHPEATVQIVIFIHRKYKKKDTMLEEWLPLWGRMVEGLEKGGGH